MQLRAATPSLARRAQTRPTGWDEVEVHLEVEPAARPGLEIQSPGSRSLSIRFNSRQAPCPTSL